MPYTWECKRITPAARITRATSFDELNRPDATFHGEHCPPITMLLDVLLPAVRVENANLIIVTPEHRLLGCVLAGDPYVFEVVRHYYPLEAKTAK